MRRTLRRARIGLLVGLLMVATGCASPGRSKPAVIEQEPEDENYGRGPWVEMVERTPCDAWPR